MRTLVLTLLCMAGLVTSAMAQTETLLSRSDGAHVTVRTDESGTTVNDEKQGTERAPISPEEKAHWDKVFELTQGGARVLSHRTPPPAR
jgi:hypothetical protein